jgi:mono/diheme cytochrome c family protein
MDPLDPSIFADQDMEDTMTWLATLPRPTTGAELFSRYCSFCHGASGKGGDTEYATAYHSAPFSRQDLTSFTAYVQAGHVMESGTAIAPSERRKYMPPFASVLSASEISLIFSWAKAQ